MPPARPNVSPRTAASRRGISFFTFLLPARPNVSPARLLAVRASVFLLSYRWHDLIPRREDVMPVAPPPLRAVAFGYFLRRNIIKLTRPQDRRFLDINKLRRRSQFVKALFFDISADFR